MPGVVEPEPEPEAVEPPLVELPFDDTPPRPYVVLSQHVELEIDFKEKCVHGRSIILVAPTTGDASDLKEVYIDARQCEIDVKQITASNCGVEATYKDPCHLIKTPENFRWSAPQWGVRKHRMNPLRHHRRKEVSALDHVLVCQPRDGSVRIKIPSLEEIKRRNQDASKSEQRDILLNPDGTVGSYKIVIPFSLRSPSDGLHFVGVDETDTRYPHVYTRHSIEPGTASSIFPCIDDPSCRSQWRVSITCPRTLGDAFQQALATQQPSKGTLASSGSRKRKLGEDEPQRRQYALAEEDKMLDMTVVCSGFLTGEVIRQDDETKKTMTFEVEKNKAAKHIGFAVGPFEHVDLWSEFRSEEDDNKLLANAVKVHGYCLPGRADEVKNTCAAIVTAIDHFVLLFGRYPFESYKLCFVDDMVEETIPLCAFSMCSNRLLYLPDIIDTEIETTRTLVYSLASQWFGVNIVPDTKADIWLVAGIAWFMTDLFMKYLCGNNDFRFRMKAMADKLVEADMKRPSLHDIGEHLYLGDFEVDFMNLKAPLVLYILDRRISKLSGSAGIARIISRMVSKANTSGQASDEVLGSEAFRKACEKVGNTKLEQFWNQWIVGSGCPRFETFQRFNKKRLCVEMTIRQIQEIAAAKVRPLNKDEFWRDVLEETHAVYAGEFQSFFTGPMTIRIHEADGTPYEHIIGIKEDMAKSVKIEIPYNTKYKRLKRNRRQRERALARGTEDGQRDLYYLGDVFQQPEDLEEWGFVDWDDDTEARMDQESYEWIRMDADFEWICEMETNLPAYMYASQLQQDRDVAAQQDSMLFLQRAFNKSGAHPLVSTILTRTLLDTRYYYGIRVMAAGELPRHAEQEKVNWIGLKHLLKTFQTFFCYPGSNAPKPNDFHDKRQYLIQSVIPEAIARVRGEDGKCPKEARRFLLELLQANDNSVNIYSDQFYICKLIKALALCQIPNEKKAKQQRMSMSLSFGDIEDEDELMEEVDPEPEQFRDIALEEIERYRRMDEYSPSFQNCFTVAALDALCQLMKANVIPKTPLTFVQYLQDRTSDVVRVKACEALVELDLLANPAFSKFLMTCAATDPSPFVRNRLFRVLCRGIAAMAIGENAESGKKTPQQPADDGLGLIVEQDNALIEARQKAKARKQDLNAALAALKEETQDDEDLQESVWNMLDSPVLTVSERLNVLELCSLLVEEEPSLIYTFKYPTYWTCERQRRLDPKKCLVRFKRQYRTKPRKVFATPAPPPRPEAKRTITLNLNRNPSFSVKPGTPAQPPAPKPPPPQAVNMNVAPQSTVIVGSPKPTIAVQKPSPAPAKRPVPPVPREMAPQAVLQEKSAGSAGSHRDSISVQTPVRPSIEVPHPEPKPSAPKVNGNGSLAPTKPARPPKRASTESDGGRPKKMVKLNTSKIVHHLQHMKSQRWVTLKFAAWDKLKTKEAESGSIRAATKHSVADKTTIGTQPGKASSPPLGTAGPSQPSSSPPTVSSSQTMAATPTSTASHAQPTQPQSSEGSSSKPRKRLPDMRKPLPSAAPGTSSTPSKPSFSGPGPVRAPTPTPDGRAEKEKARKAAKIKMSGGAESLPSLRDSPAAPPAKKQPPPPPPPSSSTSEGPAKPFKIKVKAPKN